MELNYNKFINVLLNNPSTSEKEKGKIVDLLLKERDKGFVTKEQVEQMIKEFNSNIINR